MMIQLLIIPTQNASFGCALATPNWLIYGPPLSAGNGLTMYFFYGEFSNFLEQIITEPKPLIILGDFIFHVDSPNDGAATKFIDFLETFGLKQHINVATHQSGHTLDLVMTRGDDDLV